jgi:hypothetical protein
MNIHSVVQSFGNRFGDIQTWLLLGFNIVLVPAMFYWMSRSRQWRGGTFFNVSVEPGFADSDAGRAILFRFRRRIWLWQLSWRLSIFCARYGGISRRTSLGFWSFCTPR